MTDRIRTALVGCGLVGRTHAEALQSDERSDFVAVCHPSADRAAACGERYGVRAYTDVEEMIRDAGVQMVSVCTPHPSHADIVVQAAQLGVHSMVEKPLAPDLDGCDRAIDACASAGVKLGVISQRRLYPPVVRMKDAIDAGRIGQPVLATLVVLGWRDQAYYESATWRGTWKGEGGGVLINQTPHQLDLMQWFMGPIEELYGVWDNFNHPFIEVEDSAVAVVRFQGGGLGSIVVSNSQKPGLYGRIHIHGSTGASVGAQTEGGSPFIAGVTSVIEPPFNDIWTIPGEEDRLEGWQAADRAAPVDVMSHYHRLQIADFLGAIADDRPPLVDGGEGRKVVEMITAIYRSRRDRRPIGFPLEPEPNATDYDGRLTYFPLIHRRRDNPG